jgi:WD40 repeat protein
MVVRDRSEESIHGRERQFEAFPPFSMTPDGRRAVSIGPDYSVLLWDLDTGDCLLRLKGHTAGIGSVSITPDGKRAVSGGDDCTVRVWDLEAGTCVRVLEGHTSFVWSVAITADGSLAASGGADRTIRVWNLKNGQPMRMLEDFTSFVYGVDDVPQGRAGRTLSEICEQVMIGHDGPVRRVFALPGDEQALSAGDTTLKLWELATGKCVCRYSRFCGKRSRQGRITPSGCGTWQSTRACKS